MDDEAYYQGQKIILTPTQYENGEWICRFMADRTKQLTYANKQEWRVIEKLKTDSHKHFHSDHGHLMSAESVVPMVFAVGSDPGSLPHATICHASLVDITPTILDALGLLASFENDMVARPSTPRGHSLKNARSS